LEKTKFLAPICNVIFFKGSLSESPNGNQQMVEVECSSSFSQFSPVYICSFRSVPLFVLTLHFHKKFQQDATECQNFVFHIYIMLTCFGRHTTHHQEPKTALAASGFA
jgi:hypothetical protein